MAEKKLNYKEVPQALSYVIKTLWKLSPLYVILNFIAMAVQTLLPYVTLFVTAAIVTRLPKALVDHDQTRPILMLLAALLGLELLSQLIQLVTTYLRQKSEVIVTVKMRESFYSAYARLPYRLYEDKSVIDAFQYADNFMNRFGQFGVNQITSSLMSIVEIVVAMVALVAVAWYMPFLFLIFLPFFIRSILKMNRERVRVYVGNQTLQRQVWAIEALFYPRLIKETRLYGAVAYLLAKRRDNALEMNQRESAMNYKFDRMNFAQEGSLQIVGFVATAIAVLRIVYQGAPLGTFVLAQQLTTRAGNAVQSLFSQLSQFDEDLYGFAEYRYITETLQPVPSRATKAIPANLDLRLKQLSFAYPASTKKALRDVTIDMPFGTTLAIVGENGAGKTTLSKLLLGLYVPRGGSIQVGGVPLDRIDESEWLRHIGVLLQDFGMDQDITIREAVWLGDVSKQNDDDLIYEALEAAELADTIRALPSGLDTYLGKWIDEDNGVELSGGQLQRLAIARALFRNPDILILDEPTSSIDALAEERIFKRLLTARKGKTTIFISHRFSTVRRAQQIVYMEHGRLVEQGTHHELMLADGKYAKMYNIQAEGYR